MELSGKVIAVLEPRGGVSKTGNAWKVQEYVIETHDQYPRKMCFDVFGEDKINQFNIQVGEELTVHFDIDAREWQGRWFNSIRCSFYSCRRHFLCQGGHRRGRNTSDNIHSSGSATDVTYLQTSSLDCGNCRRDGGCECGFKNIQRLPLFT